LADGIPEFGCGRGARGQLGRGAGGEIFCGSRGGAAPQSRDRTAAMESAFAARTGEEEGEPDGLDAHHADTNSEASASCLESEPLFDGIHRPVNPAVVLVEL